MYDAYEVVIVGGGHGGAHAAIKLRQEGFEGSIAIIGEECDLPYDRPSLSKDYLSGNKSQDQLAIRTEQAWNERNIDIRLGHRVTEVHPTVRQIVTDRGLNLRYEKLIWSTGGKPRTLQCEGTEYVGVHTVRARHDIDKIKAQLPSVTNVVVVGGGYIGLEAAAVLTKLGKRVTVVEAQDRVLARVAGAPLSRFFEQEHKSHGVRFRLRAIVQRIIGKQGRASGVRLSDNTVISGELVIVGIGVIPIVEPLLLAGAAGKNGVRVDEFCRTSLSDVFAIGDCAEHANRYADGAVIRLESVQNANDQGATVARYICGRTEPYEVLPWFWSNQYDLKLQTVGLSAGYDDIVVRGDPSRRRFSLVYLRDSHVIALDCVNAVQDYVQGRGLIGMDISKHRRDVGDTEIPLKVISQGASFA